MEEGPGGGGTTEDVAGSLMPSRQVRNKGVKDIFGELPGKEPHRPKKIPAEEGNDTAAQFPACNQASLIRVLYLMTKVWEGEAERFRGDVSSNRWTLNRGEGLLMTPRIWQLAAVRTRHWVQTPGWVHTSTQWR